MAKKEPPVAIEVGGRTVTITSPSKMYFPAAGITKLDFVRYYQAVAEGALRGIRGRPIVLKRYVNGVEGDFFYQKRAPKNRPSWLPVTTLRYPSGRSADELVLDEAAQLLWVANLGNLALHPHSVRAADLDHPDELRVDLDPTPPTTFAQIRRVALVAREVLKDYGLVGWPKTSGSRGFHIVVRVAPRWTHDEVRRAAWAIAREVETRVPDEATSAWWKEERHGVFIDYNQNARDHTVASAYSVRPLPDARVSAPLHWEEVPDCAPEDFTVATVPRRFAEIGDPHDGIDGSVGDLTRLLERADRFEAEGHHGPTSPTAKRRMPLITIAKAKARPDAEAGLHRWKQKHAEVVPYLEPRDILIDAMRGRSSMWCRIRINLERVPLELRPPPDTPPDPDYDPWGAPSE
ncbi:MAG: DNA polymerase domain-containing protein [Myxococcota bacterium]